MPEDTPKQKKKSTAAQRRKRKVGPNQLVPVTVADPTDRYARAEVVIQSIWEGATVEEACKAAALNVRTFYRMRAKDPELEQSIQEAMVGTISKCVDSLYRSANGYDYTEEKIEELRDLEGNVTGCKVTITKKHQPPNPASLQFFLKNRGRGRWLADQHISVESKHTERVELSAEVKLRDAMEKLNIEELEKLDAFYTTVEARVIEEDQQETTDK